MWLSINRNTEKIFLCAKHFNEKKVESLIYFDNNNGVTEVLILMARCLMLPTGLSPSVAADPLLSDNSSFPL